MLSVVLLSGGIDSAAALASVLPMGDQTEALFIRFGQPAETEEAQAARAVSLHYAVPIREVAVSGQTFEAGEIRGRNAFFIHLALLLCPGEPATIIIGVHAGTSYKDCSPEFMALMQRSLEFHTGGTIAVVAPFIAWSKADVFAHARALGVPIELTYSCERGGGAPCGKCLSCQDREKLVARAK
jgi:7-cyano-7-deazaguanine synthase